MLFGNIHFPVVSYPKNRIPILGRFVSCREILYSHGVEQLYLVAFEVLQRPAFIRVEVCSN